MNTAMKVRKDKEAKPWKYCSNPRCLWRELHLDGRVTPCPKHNPNKETK